MKGVERITHILNIFCCVCLFGTSNHRKFAAFAVFCCLAAVGGSAVMGALALSLDDEIVGGLREEDDVEEDCGCCCCNAANSRCSMSSNFRHPLIRGTLLDGNPPPSSSGSRPNIALPPDLTKFVAVSPPPSNFCKKMDELLLAEFGPRSTNESPPPPLFEPPPEPPGIFDICRITEVGIKKVELSKFVGLFGCGGCF